MLEKKVTLNLEELSQKVKNVIVKAAASTVKVLDKTKSVTITAEAKDVLVQTDALNQLTLKADGEGSFKQQLLNGDTPSNPITVEATGAQNWINSLKVISGSVPGETLVEIITASSASGSSIDFTHKVRNEEKTNLVEALKTETKTETEGTKSVTYAITGVNNSDTKHVITFKFTVKVTEGGVDTVKVVTKKVNVIVPGTKA